VTWCSLVICSGVSEEPAEPISVVAQEQWTGQKMKAVVITQESMIFMKKCNLILIH